MAKDTQLSNMMEHVQFAIDSGIVKLEDKSDPLTINILHFLE